MAHGRTTGRPWSTSRIGDAPRAMWRRRLIYGYTSRTHKAAQGVRATEYNYRELRQRPEGAAKMTHIESTNLAMEQTVTTVYGDGKQLPIEDTKKLLCLLATYKMALESACLDAVHPFVVGEAAHTSGAGLKARSVGELQEAAMEAAEIRLARTDAELTQKVEQAAMAYRCAANGVN